MGLQQWCVAYDRDCRYLALLRQILAMTDHDQQLSRFPTQIYGEAVGRTHQTGMAARPRLFGFADSQFRLVCPVST